MQFPNYTVSTLSQIDKETGLKNIPAKMESKVGFNVYITMVVFSFMFSFSKQMHRKSVGYCTSNYAHTSVNIHNDTMAVSAKTLINLLHLQ